jgi:hypothetical protein
MKNTLWRLFFLVGPVVVPSLVYGQGFYTTYQIDGGPYNAFIDTDAYGYPGSGSCGGESFWNSLNGSYISGWAPNVLESGTYGTDGVNYTWTFGFTIQYPSPYSGCLSTSFSYTSLIGYAITYTLATSPFVSDANGYCAQATYCLNTNTPRCPVPSIKEGFVSGLSCDTFHVTIVPIVNGYCQIGLSTSVAGPGNCTV